MALWYVDTTAGGANDGTSQGDAWTNIRSAFEWNGYDPGDTIYVRRNQTHTMTDAACAIADKGSAAAPISVIGDNDLLDIWADAGNVRPIVDWGAFSQSLIWSADDYWTIKGLQFNGSETYQCDSGGNTITLVFDDCVFDANGQTPTGLAKISGGATVILRDCALKGTGVRGLYLLSGGVAVFQDSTIDGCGVGIDCLSGGRALLENVSLGSASENTTADIRIYNAGVIVGRAAVLASTTEIIVDNDAEHDRRMGGYVALEDYGGTKGARLMESGMARLESIAAAATTAGQRAGGAVAVIKVSPKSAVTDDIPALVAEFPINVSSGSKTVDVWTQPDNTWAAVPDTEGADAELYVEVLAWDAATSQYKTFDSRDEGSQDAQVEGEWHKIRVTGVEADAAGTIIVRVWTFAYESGKFFHVDRIVDVS